MRWLDSSMPIVVRARGLSITLFNTAAAMASLSSNHRKRGILPFAPEVPTSGASAADAATRAGDGHSSEHISVAPRGGAPAQPLGRRSTSAPLRRHRGRSGELVRAHPAGEQDV